MSKEPAESITSDKRVRVASCKVCGGHSIATGKYASFLENNALLNKCTCK